MNFENLTLADIYPETTKLDTAQLCELVRKNAALIDKYDKAINTALSDLTKTISSVGHDTPVGMTLERIWHDLYTNT